MPGRPSGRISPDLASGPPAQISGSRDRNRALDGDTVAIELLDVDEVWASKKEKEDKKRKKEENAAFSDSHAVGQAAQRRSDKRKDDVEVEVRRPAAPCQQTRASLTLGLALPCDQGQGMMLFDDEEVTDEIKPRASPSPKSEGPPPPRCCG